MLQAGSTFRVDRPIPEAALQSELIGLFESLPTVSPGWEEACGETLPWPREHCASRLALVQDCSTRISPSDGWEQREVSGGGISPTVQSRTVACLARPR